MGQAARASIHTGRLPCSHGLRDNGRDLDYAFGAEGLAGIFGRAGYRTSFFGKAHSSSQLTFESTGKPECYFSVADCAANRMGSYSGIETAEFTLRPHHRAKWVEPPEALDYEFWLDADAKGGERWKTSGIPRLGSATATWFCSTSLTTDRFSLGYPSQIRIRRFSRRDPGRACMRSRYGESLRRSPPCGGSARAYGYDPQQAKGRDPGGTAPWRALMGRVRGNQLAGTS